MTKSPPDHTGQTGIVDAHRGSNLGPGLKEGGESVALCKLSYRGAGPASQAGDECTHGNPTLFSGGAGSLASHRLPRRRRRPGASALQMRNVMRRQLTSPRRWIAALNR